MAGDYFGGKTAVITGAGAGIGRALSVASSRRGVRLVLWDRDGDSLADTATLCRDAGGVVDTAVVDVRRRAEVQAAAEVAAAAGPVHLVFAVAGVIHTGSVLASLPEDVDRVLEVNLHGTVHTVQACLPLVAASGAGHVVTTSSAFGLVAVPKYSAYCASKAAVLAFTDALRLELRAAGAPVAVSCVLPGGVRTGIVRAGAFAPDEDRDAVTERFERRIARTTPEQAAVTILRGVARRRPRILVGRDAHAVAALVRVTGTGYQRALRAAVRPRPARDDG